MCKVGADRVNGTARTEAEMCPCPFPELADEAPRSGGYGLPARAEAYAPPANRVGARLVAISGSAFGVEREGEVELAAGAIGSLDRSGRPRVRVRPWEMNSLSPAPVVPVSPRWNFSKIAPASPGST